MSLRRRAVPKLPGAHAIPVSAPMLVGNEKVYVNECLDSTWISSAGSFVERFERSFAGYIGVRRAEACSNGTAALHLALMALGVGPGDEVIVPTLTFVSTANAASYCGATPVFVDIDARTWNLDPDDVAMSITPRTRAIIAVHLYGLPADMDVIDSIARENGLFVVEDAAEAHGAQYKGRVAGSLAHVGTFSFYGNKTLTTGEGGMVTTDDVDLADRVRLLKGQGMDPARRYWFIEVGYNYRLTNIAAAIGLAQLEKIDWHLQRRREVAHWYKERLAGVDGLVWQQEPDSVSSSWWMFSVHLPPHLHDRRDDVMADLAEAGIETRPVFPPMHQLPPYRDLTRPSGYPVAEALGASGISLPTWAGLSESDVDRVSSTLRKALR